MAQGLADIGVIASQDVARHRLRHVLTNALGMKAGGVVDFRVLPAYGSEGHWLVETEGGVKLAAAELDRALRMRLPTPAKKK